ncbi:unnamed protein product [Nesidiocoris tenuis]|uniref:USP domain-containing protein n=1 Tax=Nesidiocoris tenuis TaxID=355587 RepID=A0A6H5GPH6_9HEMI|nr:unnamed protein product [Nesidiocoris tenuis]
MSKKKNKKQSSDAPVNNGDSSDSNSKDIFIKCLLNVTFPKNQNPFQGLANLGNTCYFNSVMQCLARTEPFLEELKDMDHQTELKLELNGGDTLVCYCEADIFRLG